MATQQQLVRARELRAAMSAAEVKLWVRLRELRAQGWRLRRQVPFRGYYLDFACLRGRLAIEVDGGQHGEDLQQAHDARRDAVLQRSGFRVLRFWASDIHRDIDQVMDAIVRALEVGGSPRAEGRASSATAGHSPVR